MALLLIDFMAKDSHFSTLQPLNRWSSSVYTGTLSLPLSTPGCVWLPYPRRRLMSRLQPFIYHWDDLSLTLTRVPKPNQLSAITVADQRKTWNELLAFTLGLWRATRIGIFGVYCKKKIWRDELPLIAPLLVWVIEVKQVKHMYILSMTF